MKPIGIVWLALCLLGCLFSSCEYRKYPEGPITSVFTAEDRLTNTWRWAIAIQNEENLTGVLNDSTIEFLNNKVVRICPKEGGDCREGNWAFVTRRSKLNLIFGDSAQAFDIERLTRQEVYLRSSEGVDTYWELDAVEADE